VLFTLTKDILLQKFIQKRVVTPYAFKIRRKSNSYKSLLLNQCQKENISLRYFEDNGIDGTPIWRKLSIDDKSEKSNGHSKKERGKKHTTRLFCNRKIDKKYHIHQNYNVFVDKLTKSLHFLLLTSIETVYLQEYFH
jgi:hypothetical protein